MAGGIGGNYTKVSTTDVQGPGSAGGQKIDQKEAKTTFLSKLPSLKDCFSGIARSLGIQSYAKVSTETPSIINTETSQALNEGVEMGSASGTGGGDSKEGPTPKEIHKNSTLSQLSVAIENFKLAGKECGLSEDEVTTKAADLKSSFELKINDAYSSDNKKIDDIDKQFRIKGDDFGLSKELTVMLDKNTYGMGSKELSAIKKSMVNLFTNAEVPGLSKLPGLKHLTKFIIKPVVSNTLGRILTLNGHIQSNDRIAAKAMANTKSSAINTIGTEKANKLFKNEGLCGGKYQTSITKQTDEFVSSAANKSNGNTCGNLNLQTLQDSSGKTKFKTLRQAAITAKPVPKETNVPKFLSDQPNADEFAKKLKARPDQSKLTKLGIETKEFATMDDKTAAKKVAKQCALLNKALDVGKAAYEASDNKTGTINITSQSLMTPDRPRAGLDGTGGEIGKLADQTEAFQLLSNLNAEDLNQAGIGGGQTTIKVNTFNFGVNEGESLGASNQKEMNDEAMQQLLDTTEQSVKDLNTNLQDADPGSKEHTELSVKIRTMHSLIRDISESYQTYSDMGSYNIRDEKGWWRADQAYTLTEKIAFLTELNGDINTCNCASGKDRTGMHVQNSLSYASLMSERMEEAVNSNAPIPTTIDTRDALAMIRDNKYGDPSVQDLQARNKDFMLHSGQHEVQEWNTGSPGYKLYSDTLPNLVTWGQTEGYFSELTGMSKQEGKEQITMQAKFNAT